MGKTDNFALYCENCRDFPNSVEVASRNDGVYVKCGMCECEELWEV